MSNSKGILYYSKEGDFLDRISMFVLQYQKVENGIPEFVSVNFEQGMELENRSVDCGGSEITILPDRSRLRNHFYVGVYENE